MSDDASFDGVVTPDRLGWLILLTLPPIYALPAHFAFDAPLFGALAGLSMGLGVKLFLPYFMPASPSERAAETPNYGGDVRRTAAGIGLFAGGFVLFNARFVTEGFLVHLAAAALVALALFVPLDRLLPAEPASE